MLDNSVINDSKKRNSALELLRIVSIIFIIMSHYWTHGAYNFMEVSFSFNKFLSQLLILGNLGVDIYILISGYFLIKSNFKLRKLLKILLQVFIYSIMIYSLLCLLGLIQFNLKDFIKAFFPTIYKQYWFVTAYIVMYILSPYINKLIFSLDKKHFFKFILLLLCLVSFIPTFFRSDLLLTQIAQFILLYCLGAYIRLYPNKATSNKKMGLLGIFIFGLLFILSILVLNLIGWNGNLLNMRNSILIIGLAVSIFIFFANMEMKYNKVINLIATATFGVYLIHDNLYLREIIWGELFNNTGYAASSLLIIHVFISVILVFVSCTIIELIRQHLFEKPLFKIIDKKWEGWSNKANTIFEKVKCKYTPNNDNKKNNN